MTFSLPPPLQQVHFARLLGEARPQWLADSLAIAVRSVDLPRLNEELSQFAPAESLSLLASRGLRGERLFATPILLSARPQLLGYYRLLLGYSQKEFYGAATGLSRFKSMEHSSRPTATGLHDLCKLLNKAASQLLGALPEQEISPGLLDELSLLTLGPQFRGAANNRRGSDATVEVFTLVRELLAKHLLAESSSRLELRNAAGRNVAIELAADPDLTIKEFRADGTFSNKVALEIKGGMDYSNIHNRLGEAEKSHIKAREAGFVQCWTVFNVEGLEEESARANSPSTHQFFRLGDIRNRESDGFRRFRNLLIEQTGIPD